MPGARPAYPGEAAHEGTELAGRAALENGIRGGFAPRQIALCGAHVVVGALVVFVAIVGIGVPDAAPDEDTYRSCAESYLHGHFSCNLEHPLLAKELMSATLFVGGDSITAARVAAALAALATAWCCYLFVTDVAGCFAGLVAATPFGGLGQQGVEGSVTLEVVRIDRYGLLDPFVACFFAAALTLGRRWWKRGGWRLAAATGAACAAAACSKATGILVAPVVLAIPLVAAARRHRLAREAGAALAAGVLVAVISYAPLGPSGAIRAIRYMFSFQDSYPDRTVLVASHVFFVAPWWADFSFAIVGLSLLVAVALAAAAAVGALGNRGPALYALGAAASIVLVTGVGLHFSAPHYYLDWLPGLAIGAGVGFGVLMRHRSTRLLGVALLVVLVAASVSSVRAVVDVVPGPYELAAPAASCEGKCVAAYVGYIDILVNYMPSAEQLVPGPPVVIGSAVVVEARRHGKPYLVAPQIVVIDPATIELHPNWRRDITNFETDAARVGYERLASPGRIEVYRRSRAA